MRILKYLFLVFLFYIYCFSLVFTFFPVSSKIILALVGIAYVIIKLLTNKYKIKKEYVWILGFSFFVCFWDILISYVSGYKQFHFIDYMMTPISSVFGAGLLYEYSKKIINSEDKFLLFFVFIVFSECVLTLAMNLTPSLYNMVMNIQITDMGDKEVNDIEGHFRMIGIGKAVFFGVLPICTFALLSCSYLLIKNIASFWQKTFVVVSFIIISITYFFCARTTIAIVAIAIFYLLYNLKSVGVKNFMVFIVVVLLTIVLSVKFIELYFNDSMLEWALGFIVDKDMDTESVDGLVNWWKNTEFSPITFIVGDGCYSNPDGTYYGHVDVGWFRIIYYSGIIGVFLILFFHYKLSLFIYKYCRTREMKLMLMLLLLSYCLILLKGDTILLAYFILFLVYYSKGIFDKKSTGISKKIATNNIKYDV